MSDIISLNGQNYMKMPHKLIVETIFAEMSKCWTFDSLDRVSTDVEWIARDLAEVVDEAARSDGHRFSQMPGGPAVVVKDGIISVLYPIPAGHVIGQFDVATAEAKAFMASELISTEGYAQLKAEMPELIRREFKSLNAKVINALLEAVAHHHFGMSEMYVEEVYFNNFENWVSFESSENRISFKSGISVVWYEDNTRHQKFIPLAELID